jgi:BolA protein
MSRKDRIELLLNQELNPIYLNVEDESANHHVPEGAQTHFKVTAVSARFFGLTLIARHRLLNQLLSQEFDLGLHALSIHLYTAQEWEKNNHTVLKSPSCRDGYKNN